MKIKILMEDTNGEKEAIAQHGLSVYVETDKHRLMLDTGASDKTFINAQKMEVDIRLVDTLVLSHGHYDHSGGIMTFADKNSNANIYIHKLAGLDYFHKYINPDSSVTQKYIGIDKDILNLERVIKVDGNYRIDDELSLFSDISKRRLWPQSNTILTMKKGDDYVQDEFNHEQCLVIEAENKTLLLSGCAHNGILNILDRFRMIYNREPDYVISGFHMMKDTEYTKEERDNIIKTAEELIKLPTVFYSGHCTGGQAMDILKSIMKDKLIAIHAGDFFEI